MQMKRFVLLGLLMFLVSVYASPAVFGGFAVKLVDKVPKGEPKGYVSFFFNAAGVGGSFDLYRVENGVQTLEAKEIYPESFWLKKQEFRIAEVPGFYTFQIRHNTYVGDIQVTVVENGVTYVTIQTQVTKKETNSGTVTTYYNIQLTSGQSYIPVEAGKESLNDLLSALDDEDMSTRWAALNGLSEILSKLKKEEKASIILKLKDLYDHERYYELQQEMKRVLKKLDNPVEEKDNDVFYRTGFTDNYSNWFLDEKKYYLNQNGYNLDQDRENYNWVNMNFDNKFPSNYSLELDATWKKGTDNYAYGIVLGPNEKSFYNFCITRNGSAVVQMFKDAKYVKEIMAWKPVGAVLGDKNRIKVQLSAGTFSFYVNNRLVGSFNDESGFTYQSCGLIVSGKQSICFNLLKIVKLGA